MEFPLPANGEIISSIRSSCKDARIAANILINEESIDTLLQSPLFISTFFKLSQSHGVAMPLNFPSKQSEVNLISVLSLLNFGHGYRVPLKKATGRGAYDSIRALIFGLYLSSTDDDDLLSAKGMKQISRARIAELMQLTNHIHVEKSHPTIPGLTIGELGGPLYELVNEITSVLNETGAILLNRGYSNLGAFVLDALKKGQNGEEPIDPEVVLGEIIRAFPAFQDVGSYNDKPVYVFKKALFLLHALVLRFGKGRVDHQIPLPNTDNLPIFSDNVIPSMLVHFGILELQATNLPNLRTAFGRLTVAENLQAISTDAEMNKSSTEVHEGPKLSKEEAYVLRSASIDVCEMIVQKAKGMIELDPRIQAMTLPELDGWLWSVAKEGRLRTDLTRFREVPTVMY